MRVRAHARTVATHAAHNVLLSAWSALLLCGLALAVGTEAAAGGLMHVWCDPLPHVLSSPHRLVAFFYMNYLTKYYVRAVAATHARRCTLLMVSRLQRIAAPHRRVAGAA